MQGCEHGNWGDVIFSGTNCVVTGNLGGITNPGPGLDVQIVLEGSEGIAQVSHGQAIGIF